MEEGAANNPLRLATDSHSRENRATIFKELSDNFAKLFALLFAAIAILKTDKGDAFLQENEIVTVAIMVVTVLYFFVSIIGAVLQLHIRNSLPLLVLFVLGSVVSVSALGLISSIVMWIAVVLCDIAFVMIAYYHYQELPERIKQWIENIKQRIVSVPERIKLKHWIEKIKQWTVSVPERIKHWIENYKSGNARLPI